MTAAAQPDPANATYELPITFFRPGELTVLVEPLSPVVPTNQDGIPPDLISALRDLLKQSFPKIEFHEKLFAVDGGVRQPVLLMREGAGPLVLHTLNLASWFDESVPHDPSVHNGPPPAEAPPASLTEAGAAPPITHDLVKQAIADVGSAVAAINAAAPADRMIPGKLRLVAASPNWLASTLCV